MCDAVTEHDLVFALQVSVYLEIIFFTKAGKILYLRKVIFILGTHMRFIIDSVSALQHDFNTFISFVIFLAILGGDELP